ncbi:hypothetical protein C900_00299 [Fulvivirga imtechensis AK7]|uniref:Uncharacterized protein n=1 Tax=Fulvivirga imtechensis AK7 TaxID=1237149 RepID=L8JJX5_9BACT|nr:hypothetical protein C900_00299 [Fulvivirga imtechensis AK7]
MIIFIVGFVYGLIKSGNTLDTGVSQPGAASIFSGIFRDAWHSKQIAL